MDNTRELMNSLSLRLVDRAVDIHNLLNRLIARLVLKLCIELRCRETYLKSLTCHALSTEPPLSHLPSGSPSSHDVAVGANWSS